MNPAVTRALGAWILALLGVPDEVIEFLEAFLDWSTASALKTLLQPSTEPLDGRFPVSSKLLQTRCPFGLSVASLLLSSACSCLLIGRPLTRGSLHVHDSDPPAGNGQKPLDGLAPLVRRDLDLQRLVRSQLGNDVAVLLQRDRGNHEDETAPLVVASSEAPRLLRIEWPRQLDEEPIVVEEEVDDVDVLLHQLIVHPEDVGHRQRVHRSHATAPERQLIERSKRAQPAKGGACRPCFTRVREPGTLQHRPQPSARHHRSHRPARPPLAPAKRGRPRNTALGAWILALLGVPDEVIGILEALIEWCHSRASAKRELRPRRNSSKGGA